MGQRSHLVLGYQTGSRHQGDIENNRISRYFSWNWGHFMIQRAAQAARFAAVGEGDKYYDYKATSSALGLTAMFCVNQVTGDVQGMGKHDDESAYAIADTDNNNGAFLMDVDLDGNWTFGFLVGSEDGGDLKTVVSAADYIANFSVDHLDEEERELHDKALAELTEYEANGHAMTQETADRLAVPLDTTPKNETVIAFK